MRLCLVTGLVMIKRTKQRGKGEAEFWERIHGKWELLFGGFEDVGVSVEWHEFYAASDLDWAASFHPESLEFCVNLEGVAEFFEPGHVAGDGTVIWYATECPLKARRRGGMRHQFLTVEMQRAWFERMVGEGQSSLHVELNEYLRGRREGVLRVHPARPMVLQLARMLEGGGPGGQARQLWLQARLLDLLCWEMFTPEPAEQMVGRKERSGRLLAAKVCALLEKNLENPPLLTELARQAGCSQFHLSRIFSREMKTTISRYLRDLRMKRAADLLATGRYNVTEAAMEVGYNSLSHFSKAFADFHGTCPCNFSLPVGGVKGSKQTTDFRKQTKAGTGQNPAE